MSQSLWKNRDFVLLITGRTVSQFGTAMTTFVIPWLFLQITGSAKQTGIAFAVGFIPYLLLSLPAGVWSDRLNRRTLMIATDFSRLVLLATIPFVHFVQSSTPLVMLYAIQVFVSACSAIFDAAYGACLPNLVESSLLLEANNTLQTSLSLSKMLGPIIGGVFVTWIGSTNTILVDVLSYIVSILTMFAIRSSFSTIRKLRTSTFREDIREGISTVWEIKPIRYLIVVATLVNFVGPGMDVALLYRIQHELLFNSKWAGIIMMGLSGGMLVGSLINRWVGKRIDIGPWLTISAILQVFPPIFLSFIKTPFLICSIQVCIGVLLVAFNVQAVTLRQSLIPDHLLGRCSSVFRLFAWISIPIGDAIAGMISEDLGTHFYFVLAACVLLLVSLLCLFTKLHRVISPIDTLVY